MSRGTSDIAEGAQARALDASAPGTRAYIESLRADPEAVEMAEVKAAVKQRLGVKRIRQLHELTRKEFIRAIRSREFRVERPNAVDLADSGSGAAQEYESRCKLRDARVRKFLLKRSSVRTMLSEYASACPRMFVRDTSSVGDTKRTRMMQEAALRAMEAATSEDADVDMKTAKDHFFKLALTMGAMNEDMTGVRTVGGDVSAPPICETEQDEEEARTRKVGDVVGDWELIERRDKEEVAGCSSAGKSGGGASGREAFDIFVWKHTETGEVKTQMLAPRSAVDSIERAAASVVANRDLYDKGAKTNAELMKDMDREKRRTVARRKGKRARKSRAIRGGQGPEAAVAVEGSGRSLTLSAEQREQWSRAMVVVRKVPVLAGIHFSWSNGTLDGFAS